MRCRMWGRLLGLAFAVPCTYFAVRGAITRPLAKRLALLFFMGGTQVNSCGASLSVSLSLSLSLMKTGIIGSAGGVGSFFGGGVDRVIC